MIINIKKIMNTKKMIKNKFATISERTGSAISEKPVNSLMIWVKTRAANSKYYRAIEFRERIINNLIEIKKSALILLNMGIANRYLVVNSTMIRV